MKTLTPDQYETLRFYSGGSGECNCANETPEYLPRNLRGMDRVATSMGYIEIIPCAYYRDGHGRTTALGRMAMQCYEVARMWWEL